MSAPSPILSVTGLSRRYGALTVVDNVSFEIAAGEAVGILGPNGAGKTTLLKLIAGSVAATSGEIAYNGHSVSGLDAAARCRLGLARTNQVPLPFVGMTVWENVLTAALHGGQKSGSEADDATYESLSVTGLLDRHDRLADTLSLMGRKRLELSRALACSPSLLLLDEVAGGLSDYEVRDLVDLIRKIHASGVTIIWIEHIVHALLSLSSRLIALDFGVKIADGRPHDVIESPAFQRAYFGDAVAFAELA